MLNEKSSARSDLTTGLLCHKHRQELDLNPEKGCVTWLRMMRAGNTAFAENELDSASSHFGAAYEIARLLIQNQLNYPGRFYASERLLTATHNLSVTLARQNRHPVAGELLIQMHRELLVICNDSALNADTRAAAYACLQPSLERIQPFLERARDQELAKQLVSITETTFMEEKNKLCH